MRKMKKVAVLCLTAAMTMSLLAGCSGTKKDADGTTAETTEVTTEAESTEEEETTTEKATEEETEEPTTEALVFQMVIKSSISILMIRIRMVSTPIRMVEMKK